MAGILHGGCSEESYINLGNEASQHWLVVVLHDGPY